MDLSLLHFLLAAQLVELDFEHPENNDGMLVLKGNEITIGFEMINVVTIIKPLEDVEDFRKGRIKAHLLPDKSGIMFSWPSVPAYLLDPDEIEKLYKMDSHGVCLATRRSHDVVATDVHSDDVRKLRHIIAHFPKGITCSNRYFNDGMDGLNLKTKLIIFQNLVHNKGRDVPCPKPMVRWKVVLETGRTVRTAPAAGRDNYDMDLDNALRDMERMRA